MSWPTMQPLPPAPRCGSGLTDRQTARRSCMQADTQACRPPCSAALLTLSLPSQKHTPTCLLPPLLLQGGDWEKAWAVFLAMKQAGLRPSTISYNALISACERCGQTDRCAWGDDCPLQRPLAGRLPRPACQQQQAEVCVSAKTLLPLQSSCLLRQPCSHAPPLTAPSAGRSRCLPACSGSRRPPPMP
jgi:pentatricopeptide repeat protein